MILGFVLSSVFCVIVVSLELARQDGWTRARVRRRVHRVLRRVKALVGRILGWTWHREVPGPGPPTGIGPSQRQGMQVTGVQSPCDYDAHARSYPPSWSYANSGVHIRRGGIV